MEQFIQTLVVSGYVVTTVLGLVFSFAYYALAKNQSEKRIRRDRDKMNGMGMFLSSIIPVVNVLYLISTLIDFKEETEVYKKNKKEEKKERENPHWQAQKNFEKMYNLWFKILNFNGYNKKIENTRRIIGENKEHPAIRYLLLEHEEMFLEALGVHEEIEKLENEQAKTLIKNWMELFDFFGDEVALFAEKERELEVALQNKRFEELVKNVEQKKTQIKKKSIKKVYQKVGA